MTITDDIAIVDQSLADFLSKPYFLGTTLWTTSNTQNTDIVSYNVTTSLLGNTAWTNKLSGYSLFRGTAVLTIVHNANPFQQGKLFVNYVPIDTQISAADASFLPMHRTLLASKRMLPGVEIDVNDSGAILKMPYVTPANWFADKGVYRYSFGSFFLTVLAQLRTGATGEADINVSAYLHFEDVEFAGPNVPQSDFKSRKFDARSLEKDALKGSVISKGLSLASSISDSLSSIPLLSPVSKPASWVFRGLSGLASHFGWSKPQLGDVPHSVSRQYQRYAATADGPDVAYPLALISDNESKIMKENSLVDSDEMAMEYLKRISTVVSTVNWTTSNASGVSLLSKSIGPAYLYQSALKTIATHTATYAVGPPIFYLSNLFTSFRGSIKLTIKVAKTSFHTGRLQVTFTPRSTAVTTVPTLSTATLALREIIDLRCGNEFTLDLPYLLESNYQAANGYMGQLDIVVLNELRCPETAANSVDLLLYYSAGDDFEFQGFANGQITSQVFSPQMDCKQLVNEVIGHQKVPKRNLNYAAESFGEDFSSVKQLLNRNSSLPYTSAAGLGTDTVHLFPYAAGVMSMNVTTGVLQGSSIGGDIFSYLLGMYLYYRGAVRIVLTPAAPAIVIGTVQTLTTPINPSTSVFYNSGNNAYNQAPTNWIGTPNPTTAQTLFNGIVQTDHNAGIASFIVPYYNQLKSSLCTYQDSTAILNVADLSLPKVLLNLTLSTGTWTNCGVSRSFADNFQLSYFVGCPPLLINYV